MQYLYKGTRYNTKDFYKLINKLLTNKAQTNDIF